MLSGWAAGDDVRDLMAAAAPSHVPRHPGKHVLRAAPTSPKPAGRTAPRWPSHAPGSAGCGLTPPDYPTGSSADDRTRGPRRPPASHLRGASGGCSSGCSCGESVAVRLRPLLSRKVSNSLVRGPSWTLTDDHERDHDGLAVWGQGFASPQLHPNDQAVLRIGERPESSLVSAWWPLARMRCQVSPTARFPCGLPRRGRGRASRGCGCPLSCASVRGPGPP